MAEKPIWEKANPKKKSTPMTASQKAKEKKLTEQYTQTLEWYFWGDLYEIFSRSLEEATVTGIGFVQPCIDSSQDDNSEIKAQENISYGRKTDLGKSQSEKKVDADDGIAES